MNLTQVEYFLAIAEKLNFTAAAKSLFVSQPALSKQIALLEEELDTKLFIRSNKKVVLTKAGIQFQKDLQHIIRQMDEAKEHAWRIGREDKKIFRIGCFDGAATADFLPKVFERVKEISPDIQIDMRRGNFSDVRRALREDEVDIIFTLDFELAELYDFQSREVAKRKGYFVFSEKSALAKKENLTEKDFNDQTFLVMKPENSFGGYHNAMSMVKSLGIHPRKVEKMNDMVTMLTYIELGYGYAILDGSVADSRRGLKKYRIDSEKNYMSVVAVWKYDNPFILQMLEAFE